MDESKIYPDYMIKKENTGEADQLNEDDKNANQVDEVDTNERNEEDYEMVYTGLSENKNEKQICFYCQFCLQKLSSANPKFINVVISRFFVLPDEIHNLQPDSASNS